VRPLGSSLEALLWRGRHAVLVPVLASLIAAICVLFTTTVDVVRLVAGAVVYAQPMGHEELAAHHDALTTHAIEIVDGYLLAAALLVFAQGLYEIFVQRIERPTTGMGQMPVIETFDDLNNQLARVIILILIVNLFRDALAVPLKSALDLVYQGGAIALVGLALYLGHNGKGARGKT
jgi:uncharacterized membrane protein YqhA